MHELTVFYHLSYFNLSSNIPFYGFNLLSILKITDCDNHNEVYNNLAIHHPKIKHFWYMCSVRIWKEELRVGREKYSGFFLFLRAQTNGYLVESVISVSF